MKSIKNLTDRYGGDAEALYIIIEQNRNKQFRHSEEPDRKTENNKNAPRPSAQDTGSAGNGGTSGEIGGLFAHLTSFSAPRKKSASFNERGQQEGAGIITAESQLHIEHVEIGHQNSDFKANTITPHTGPPKPQKNVCDLCGAEAVTTEFDGALVCEECLQRLGKEEQDLLGDDF